MNFDANPPVPREHREPKIAPDPQAEILLQLLRAHGVTRFRALGSSTNPWIRKGDILTIRRVDPAAIRRGHVVFYRSGGSLFAHRVVGKVQGQNELLLVTRRDAVPSPDAPVAASQVLGRVIWIERFGRGIDLESPAREALGWLLACFSALSRWTRSGSRSACCAS
jgi:signal peptidase I